jgi:hypothetical protein
MRTWPPTRQEFTNENQQPFQSQNQAIIDRKGKGTHQPPHQANPSIIEDGGIPNIRQAAEMAVAERFSNDIIPDIGVDPVRGKYLFRFRDFGELAAEVFALLGCYLCSLSNVIIV